MGFRCRRCNKSFKNRKQRRLHANTECDVRKCPHRSNEAKQIELDSQEAVDIREVLTDEEEKELEAIQERIGGYMLTLLIVVLIFSIGLAWYFQDELHILVLMIGFMVWSAFPAFELRGEINFFIETRPIFAIVLILTTLIHAFFIIYFYLTIFYPNLPDFPLIACLIYFMIAYLYLFKKETQPFKCRICGIEEWEKPSKIIFHERRCSKVDRNEEIND